jgi:hypothetical protein
LTSIHAHVGQRRLLVILALVMIGLFGALLVVCAADGHLHIGGAAVLSMDETSVDLIINSLLVVIGVIAVPQALWRIARRIAPPDDRPYAQPLAALRVATPASPCLLALCRIQV